MILVFLEIDNGQFKSTSIEAARMAALMAQNTGDVAKAISVGSGVPETAALGGQGIETLEWVETPHAADASIYAQILADYAKENGVKTILTAKSAFADALSARLSGLLGAAYVGNVVQTPTKDGNAWSIKRSIFSGKAFENLQVVSESVVLAIKKNAIETMAETKSVTVNKLQISTKPAAAQITETIKATAGVSLPEANIVVSGGRGMQGPDKWQPLLDLASALGAATGCSKPVSDMDWRPHHEHVGQTGVKVSPNLYIACGISGAIQHLAGVNSSRVIVVINKDPEAPFFKAADYGIVGDVFEVLPKLTAAAQQL